jgi:hypothetical protein
METRMSSKNGGLMTREEFLGWFEGSVVADEAGRPLEVCHGTDAVFDRFRAPDNDIGIHFGSPAQASELIEHRLWRGRFSSGVHIVPAYLQLRNPLRTIDYGEWGDTQFARNLLMDRHISFDEFLEARKSASGVAAGVREVLQRKGYDGIIYQNTFEVPGRTARLREEAVLYEAAARGRDRVPKSEFGTPQWRAYLAAVRERRKLMRRGSGHSYLVFSPDQAVSALALSPEVRAEIAPRAPMGSRDGSSAPSP